MAFIHFSVGSRSKLLDRAPASVHCAYLLREPYTPAQAHVNYIIRESEKTQTREDLVYKAAVNLPTWANDSPATFFALGETHARVNAVLGQTRTVALPRELDRAQQIALAHDFLASQFGTRHAYAFAIHAAQASDGRQNDHLHVIYSTKVLPEVDRGPEHFWPTYTPKHPDRGGAQVDAWFSERRALYAQRQAFADCCNHALEAAGSDARVSPLSFEQRGISRAREAHLDAWHPTQHKHGRGTSAPWQQRLDGQEDRAAARAAEHRQAAQEWDARKQQLGVMPDMPREAFLARVYEATRAYRPERRLTPAELAVEAPLVEQQRHVVHQMATVVLVEQARQRTGQERSAAAAQRQQTVWQQAAALGLGREARDLTHRWEKPLIGHRESLIYHTPEHKNYGDVHPKHQVHFWTEQQAIDAGYRRAANDHYGRGTGEVMMVEERQGRRETPRHAPSGGVGRTPRTPLEDRVAAIRARQASRGLAAALDQLEDDAPQGGVKVRLHDKEHDRGYSY